MAKAKKTKEAKVVDMNQVQQEAQKLELSFDAANSFIRIVGIVMLNDVRANTLIQHFTNVLESENPWLKQASQQQAAPEPETESEPDSAE